MAKKLGTITPTDNNKTRMTDLIDIFTFPKNKWVTFRLLDLDVLPIKQHWIAITTNDGNVVTIPKFCVNFNVDTEEDIPNVKCPYCALSPKACSTSKFYLANAIVREYQEEEPASKRNPTTDEIETGFKDFKSKSWTPVRVLRLPMSLAKSIQSLSQLNKVRNKKTSQDTMYDVSHPKYGADISIMFDDKAKGASMYSVQLAGRTELTEEELKYLVWNLSSELVKHCGLESEAQASQNVNRMKLVETNGDDDESKASTKSKSNAGKPKTYATISAKPTKTTQLSEDEDASNMYDEDEEDNEPPVSKPKAKAKSKPKTKPDPIDNDNEIEDDIPF